MKDATLACWYSHETCCYTKPTTSGTRRYGDTEMITPCACYEDCKMARLKNSVCVADGGCKKNYHPAIARHQIEGSRFSRPTLNVEHSVKSRKQKKEKIDSSAFAVTPRRRFLAPVVGLGHRAKFILVL